MIDRSLWHWQLQKIRIILEVCKYAMRRRLYFEFLFILCMTTVPIDLELWIGSVKRLYKQTRPNSPTLPRVVRNTTACLGNIGLMKLPINTPYFVHQSNSDGYSSAYFRLSLVFQQKRVYITYEIDQDCKLYLSDTVVILCLEELRRSCRSSHLEQQRNGFYILQVQASSTNRN